MASPDVLAASRRGDVRGRRVNERARVVRRLDSSGQIRIASRWFLPRRACGNNSSCSRSHTMKFLRTSSTSSTTRRSDPPERPATDAGALQGLTWRRRAGGSLRPEEDSNLHPVIRTRPSTSPPGCHTRPHRARASRTGGNRDDPDVCRGCCHELDMLSPRVDSRSGDAQVAVAVCCVEDHPHLPIVDQPARSVTRSPSAPGASSPTSGCCTTRCWATARCSRMLKASRACGRRPVRWSRIPRHCTVTRLGPTGRRRCTS